MTHRNLVKLAYQRQLVGAGIGALGGGGLGYLGASRGKEEDDRAFGARRLRNTLIGAAVGGGLGAGVGHYTRPTPTVITPHTPAPSAEKAITAPAVPSKPASPLPEDAPSVRLSAPAAAKAPAPAVIATQSEKAAPAAAEARAAAAAAPKPAMVATNVAERVPAADVGGSQRQPMSDEQIAEMRAKYEGLRSGYEAEAADLKALIAEHEAGAGATAAAAPTPSAVGTAAPERPARLRRRTHRNRDTVGRANPAAETPAAAELNPQIIASGVGRVESPAALEAERAEYAGATAAAAPTPTRVATDAAERVPAADAVGSQRQPMSDEPKPERGLGRYREIMAQRGERTERYRAPTPSAVGTAAAETPAAAELKPQIIASDVGRVESPAAQLSAAAAPAAQAPAPTAVEAAAKGRRKLTDEESEKMRNAPAAVAERRRRAELRQRYVEKPRYASIQDSGDYADIARAIDNPYDNNHYLDALNARGSLALRAHREIRYEIADALGVQARDLNVGRLAEGGAYNDPSQYKQLFEQLQRAHPTEYARAVAQIEDPILRGFLGHHKLGPSDEAMATARRINSRLDALYRTGEMSDEVLAQRAADGSLSNVERLAATLRSGQRKANAERHNLLAKDDYGALLESAEKGNIFSAKSEEAIVGDTLKKVREHLYPNGFVPREGPKDTGQNRVLYLRGGVNRADQSAAVRQQHTDPIRAALAAMRNDRPEEFAKLLARSGEGELTQMERSLLQHYGALDRAPAAPAPPPSLVGTAVGNRSQPGAGAAAAPAPKSYSDDGTRDHLPSLPKGYRSAAPEGERNEMVRAHLAEDAKGRSVGELEGMLTNPKYGPTNRAVAEAELARRRAVEDAQLDARLEAGGDIFGVFGGN